MAMNNQNQSYYAVIPANVRYSKEVCDGAKLLYAEITSLCNKEGYCWAQNAYFAELYSKSSDTISRWISELARAGFILTLVDSAEGNSRKIWLSESQGIGKNAEMVSAKMPRGYRQKCREGIGKNAEYNNKVNNKRNSVSETPADAGGNETLEAEKKETPPPSSVPPPPPGPQAILTAERQILEWAKGEGLETVRLRCETARRAFSEDDLPGIVAHYVSIYGATSPASKETLLTDPVGHFATGFYRYLVNQNAFDRGKPGESQQKTPGRAVLNRLGADPAKYAEKPLF